MSQQTHQNNNNNNNDNNNNNYLTYLKELQQELNPTFCNYNTLHFLQHLQSAAELTDTFSNSL